MLLLTACGDLPRDPDGTLERIENSKEIRVGATTALPPKATRLLETIERRTHATAHVTTGALEPMLARLDEGEVDLVLAPFRADSPLTTSTTLSPSILRSGKGEKVTEWRAAVKSGENRWLVLVETSARAVGAPE